MAIVIILLLLIALIILGFDYIGIFANWIGRIKIGTIQDDGEWKEATRKVVIRWLDKGTPKLPVNENKKLRIFDAVKNVGKVESTSYWQDAAILKAASGIKDSDAEIFSLLERYIDTDNGKWKKDPVRIDCAILAYEMLCCNFIDNDSIKPAMDKVADLLKRLYDLHGTVPYNPSTTDVRFVDTIGMICPFLIKYALEYNKSEFVDIALEQIKEYKKYGFDKETKMPYHCFNVKSKAPLGICGWGRGCAWWMLGITDSLRTLMTTNSYNIEKVTLLKYCLEFAVHIKGLQRDDGAFGRMLFTSSLEDSSAGAMIAYCLACVSKLTDNDELKKTCKKTLGHLKSCTRRNGVIDYSQGDTMGIGFYSDGFRVVPAAQGFAVAAVNEIDL